MVRADRGEVKTPCGAKTSMRWDFSKDAWAVRKESASWRESGVVPVGSWEYRLEFDISERWMVVKMWKASEIL